MITIDPDAGTITYTRNASINTNQAYNYVSLPNGNGTQDLVKIPPSGISFSASNLPSASYPPNPPWQIEEIYVNFYQDVGAVRSYSDGFHRTNGGTWDHYGKDPAILIGNPWSTDAEHKLCDSVSIVRSEWVYGLDPTLAFKVNSAVITINKEKVRAAYPELDLNGRVRCDVLVYGYRAPCEIRLSGLTPILIDAGGETVSSSTFLTLTPETAPPADPSDRWDRGDVLSATFAKECVPVVVAGRSCPE